MRQQNTYQNIFSKYQKKLNSEIPSLNIIHSKKLKNRKIFPSSNIKIKDYICKEHNINYEKYCLECKEDICSKCYNNSHLIHDVIEYNEMCLNEEEIKIFKEKYDEYIDKYYELMNKIKEWQKILNKNIKDFEDYMELNIINVIKKMINEYNSDNLNYNTIIEYRTAYSLLIENNEDKLNNQKIIQLMKTYRNLKKYDEYKYINGNENISTISLDKILLYNDLINKGNFVKKGNNIINFLFSNYSLYFNKNEDSIIKKLVDLKQRNNNMNKIKKLNKSSTNLFNKSSNNFKNILFNKNIYEKKKPFDKKKNIETHLEKEELPIFNKNNKIQYEDEIKDNININSIIKEKNKKEKLNECKIIWKNKNYYNNIEDNLDDIDLDLEFNYNTEDNKRNRMPIIFNNNINNFNSINNINNKNNYINNYNIEKVYSDRSHKSKVFTHKKYNSTLTEFRSTKNINTLNQSQSDNDEIIKEGEYNTVDFNNYNYDTNIIKSNYNSNNTLSNKIFPENENINIKKEIEIDPDKDINIGFELGNSFCRIGVINNNLNDIIIWKPYENKNEIPSIISFKDNNDNILIGKEAEEERINNPNYTIFNFVKLIGKNWDEIDGIKELWGFKLYKDNKTERPYIKGYHKTFRNKIYFIEDILTLFLKNIFDVFFSIIKINKKKFDLLTINFVISVPNNFNYLQRKVVEKIFLNQLFVKNSKFQNKENIYYIGKNNIENIQIKNIKIENSSNLGFLYTFQNKIEKIVNNKNNYNILIYIEGSSVNVSLINTLMDNINKYEIKGIDWISFGEEDFIDNFENYYLNKKEKEEYYKSPSSLAKLRKTFEKAKNTFYKETQTEIIINDMKLNKNDYEKSCEKQFNDIIDLIDKLLKKSLVTENQIENILFIGDLTNVNIIKKKLSNIFKNKNNFIYKKLLIENEEEINQNLIVIGAAIQSYNLFSRKKEEILYKYKEISPISFGIEGIDKKIIFMIKKGNQIPIKVNKYVNFKIIKEEYININIYEGKEEYVYKNRLISKAIVGINNLNNEKREKDSIKLLIQFIINQNFDLRVFILDTKTSKRKLECVINIDIIQE